jgi:hypothetical protein
LWERLFLGLGHLFEAPSHLHPGQLVPVLVHWLEIAAVAAAGCVALTVAVMVARRLMVRGDGGSAGVERFRVLLPETFEREGLLGFFRTLSFLLRPRLFGQPSVAFTIETRGQRLAVEVACSTEIAASTVAGLEAAIPGVYLDELPVDGLGADRRRWARCVLRSAGSRWLPLEARHKTDPARHVLAMLRGESESERACVQLVFSPLSRRERRRGRREARQLRTGRRGGVLAGLGSFGLELANEGLDIFTPSSGTSGSGSGRPVYRPDAWTLKQAGAIEEKTAEPLLAATIRVAVTGGDRGWLRWRLRALVAAFAQFHALGGLRAGHEFNSAKRFESRRPALRPALSVTAAEAAALLPLPVQAADTLLVLPEAPARQLAPVAEAARDGVLVGKTERSGFGDELRIDVDALTQHVHVLGPTGRGKTTLLCGMYLEAARLGLGALYAEPKGDAIDAIRARIPASRLRDVVVLDFADEQHPPALNLLACATGEEDIHAEALVGIFRRLFGSYWGPRSEDILRSALTTLLTNRDSGRSAPTLADVLNLLTDPAEQARHPVSDPVALGQFWRQWQALSVGAREQALAPVANKLRAFLGRRALRNILCQPEAPDFERIIRERKLVLVSLPARTLGDAADLIGSVLVYRVWQAAQRLGPDPRRAPFLCLVDEAHRFCRLPGGLAQALAEARGYRLGFLLAHQNLAQLGDSELAEAVHANTQSKLCFALPPLDANRMAGHFAPRLNEDDLSRLGRYRLACRISHDGRQLPAATAATQPLPAPDWDARLIGLRSDAPSRQEVEAAIIARYGRPVDSPAVGRGDPDCAPSGPPFGPPFDGGPPAGPTPQHDNEFGTGGLSDEDMSNGFDPPSRRGGEGDADVA